MKYTIVIPTTSEPDARWAHSEIASYAEANGINGGLFLKDRFENGKVIETILGIAVAREEDYHALVDHLDKAAGEQWEAHLECQRQAEIIAMDIYESWAADEEREKPAGLHR